MASPTPPDTAAADLAALDAKVNALLPPRYQHCYGSVSPTSMGTAPLKYGPNGKVAWDEIWTSFCDLALAGGPPHRGTLLEPATAEEVRAEPILYQTVVEELGRGLWGTTRLRVLPRLAPGWVGVLCTSEAMAVWLVGAIVAENVVAWWEGLTLALPAGPRFRLEKEIKNVITALAKTCHYWSGHMSAAQQAALLAQPAWQSPARPEAVRAAPDAYQAAAAALAQQVRQATGLPAAPGTPLGWVEVTCSDEAQAVWLLRAIVVENVLARRQGHVLCLPVSLEQPTPGVTAIVARAHSLWGAAHA